MNLFPFPDDLFPTLLKKALLSAILKWGVTAHQPAGNDSNNVLLRKLILTIQSIPNPTTGVYLDNLTSDPVSPLDGYMWLRTDLS